MAHLLDTSVAIPLRDGVPAILDRFAELPERPFLSMVGRVELENGVVRTAEFAARRRRALDMLLARVTVLVFDDLCADAYRLIVEAVGYSRPRVIDRMIAATALAHGLTLATLNGADFRDVPGLKLESW
ncbi:PIN domain-containing protein [Sphingosinicellaceae bacterium]|nr:PIN domain-containing protein [Sphingosinicellaceae bacterium]